MTRLILEVIAIAALTCGAVGAQDVAGSWQGTARGNPAIEIGLKISKPENGALRATLYRHHYWQDLPVDSLTMKSMVLKFSVPVIDSTFEGKIAADGRSIVGSWTERKETGPLTFVRVTPETAWKVPKTAQKPMAMAADAKAEFSVAAIKLGKSEDSYETYAIKGQGFQATNVTLGYLMRHAYQVQPRQILGMPAWAEGSRYDIAAKFEAEGQPSEEQLRQMLQKLLADRFGLTVHRDTKEFSVYALIRGKGEPKLTTNDRGPSIRTRIFYNPGPKGEMLLVAQNATMADLATLLMGANPDRQVVDQTGLPGNFDFNINYTPDNGPVRDGDGATGEAGVLPHVFEAVEEQLGLKIKATKAIVGVIVIDSVEKPSEN